MEGMRQLDEIQHLIGQAAEGEIPEPTAHLAVPTPLAGRLRDLSAQDLDLFQAVLDHGSVQAVLDAYDGSDLEAYRQLADMLRREFIVVTS
jgi:hypothetical protein